ncbi:anti-anti-sigma factor [Saccharopolyspora antimicrobica]|uniref:Anti-sigma factor antagonist n=1 Tax=Saccharopolyspora antimicrobica TaxID=455193 RepID=A0A1I4RIB6_9PSEU|nr:STAS domain-containing protein [Saccharopolyspora antimicrobica]RKT87998.1 anti-anti-sigma factor [Saccharopolyspora antimicrobica]SFM51994.1 anti-anti-sigma factor [Saccharopolyspora antimicrobica]
MIVSRSGMRQVAWTGGPAIVAPRAPSDPPVGHCCPAALRLAVEWPVPGVVVVRIGGEVDVATVPRLAELLRQRLTAAALQTVVLDLSAVTFASSAAVELLLHVQRRAEHRGVGLLVVTGEVVLRLLVITGLRERFTCRDSAAEAVSEARS